VCSCYCCNYVSCASHLVQLPPLITTNGQNHAFNCFCMPSAGQSDAFDLNVPELLKQGSFHVYSFMCYIIRVGQNRIYTPYMTIYLVISLPIIPYTHRIYMVLANPLDNQSWPALLVASLVASYLPHTTLQALNFKALNFKALNL